MKRAPSPSTRNAPSPRTASEISGCWPRRVGAEPQHRRVELHELQVAQHRAGAQRDRHAVAGGDRRVRGRREDLAEAAGRQHDRAARDGTDAVALALAHHVQGHAGDAAVGAREQVERPGRAR